jgi:hypothetical protein
MKWFYLILGLLISFNGTIYLIEPLQSEREKTIVKIQSLQSCYYSAVKFGKMDPDKSDKFCTQHSDTTLENYTDIAQQMDKITDEQYSPSKFYYQRFKNWLNF